MTKRDLIAPGGRLRHRASAAAARVRAAFGASARGAWQGLPLVVSVPALLASGGLTPVELGAPAAELAAAPAPAPAATFPVHVNEDVDRWVNRFRTGERAAFQRLLERKGVYADLIRGRLRARGMPEELVYLAMMESGLSNRAVSSASAVGLWQLMEGTARELGLRVDEWVDERRDPVRSTDAALEYLGWLHQRYGSWYLAAAAYNAGPGKIDGVLRTHEAGETDGEGVYWQILHRLPTETRHYVPRILAATLLGERAAEEGFTPSSSAPYRYDRVFVPGGTSLGRLAWLIDVDLRTLRALNRHLLQGVTPPGETYPIRVPPGLAPRVVSALVPRSRS